MFDSSPSTPAEEVSIQQLSGPIYQARGWLKLLGVLSLCGELHRPFPSSESLWPGCQYGWEYCCIRLLPR